MPAGPARRRRIRLATIRRSSASTPGISNNSEREVSEGRPEEAEPVGPVRHARQRGRVVPRPVHDRLLRQVQGARRGEGSAGDPADGNTSASSAAARGTTACAARAAPPRVASSIDWKQQDPQVPQSIWYFTDALFLGFRVVRPLTEPSDAEKAAKWDKSEPLQVDKDKRR